MIILVTFLPRLSSFSDYTLTSYISYSFYWVKYCCLWLRSNCGTLNCYWEMEQTHSHEWRKWVVFHRLKLNIQNVPSHLFTCWLLVCLLLISKLFFTPDSVMGNWDAHSSFNKLLRWRFEQKWENSTLNYSSQCLWSAVRMYAQLFLMMSLNYSWTE